MVFSDAGSEEEAFFCRLDQRSKKTPFRVPDVYTYAQSRSHCAYVRISNAPER
jgi:hypothetical protein